MVFSVDENRLPQDLLGKKCLILVVKKKGGGVKNIQLSPVKPGLIKLITK